MMSKNTFLVYVKDDGFVSQCQKTFSSNRKNLCVSSNIIKTSTVFRAYLIKKDFNFCTLVDDAYFKIREIICRVLLILF